MKIIHMESGLGNQMLTYAEYLALKMSNSDECYIETIIYEIEDCNKVICQWNGYELERIFAIKAPNIKQLMSAEEYENFQGKIVASEFWNKRWNYAPVIVGALNDMGWGIKNMRGNTVLLTPVLNTESQSRVSLKKRLRLLANEFYRSELGYHIKRKTKKLFQSYFIKRSAIPEKLFMHTDENIFTGQTLAFQYKGNCIERIDDMLRGSFEFPQINDWKNLMILDTIKNSNSVAIHARRGDMMGHIGQYYKYGYFERAVNYIKKHVNDPCFILFSDPGSIQWCKDNLILFGLNEKEDSIYYVDWNIGEESYRDMQLMSYCKHNIITDSSFGWWGAYLNENPSKITISPDSRMISTYSC